MASWEVLLLVTRLKPEDPSDEAVEESPGEKIEDFLDENWTVENVPALGFAARLSKFHFALRNLLGKSEPRMRLRLAIIHTFREKGPFLTSTDIDRELAWIKEARRGPAIEHLQKTGWIMRVDSRGYCLTQEARQLMRVFWTFLGSVSDANDGTGVSPGTEALDLGWALETGADPSEALQNLRLELETVAGIIEDGLATGSIRKLQAIRKEAGNLVTNLDRTNTFLRECRKKATLDPAEIQDAFGLMSRVFKLHSELERRLATESRNMISTMPGMSPRRIFEFFLSLSKDQLADVGERFLVTPYVPPLFVNPERFKGEAARFLANPKAERQPLTWEEPVSLPATTVDPSLPLRVTPEVEILQADLAELAERGESVNAAAFLPRSSPEESLLRLALVAQMNCDAKAAEILAPGLDVRLEAAPDEDDGPPPLDAIPHGPIRAMTAAKLHVRKKT